MGREAVIFSVAVQLAAAEPRYSRSENIRTYITSEMQTRPAGGGGGGPRRRSARPQVGTTSAPRVGVFLRCSCQELRGEDRENRRLKSSQEDQDAAGL